MFVLTVHLRHKITVLLTVHSYLKLRQISLYHHRARIACMEQQLGYWLDNEGIIVQFPIAARDFSLLQSPQTSSCAHPAPYQLVPGTLPWQ